VHIVLAAAVLLACFVLPAEAHSTSTNTHVLRAYVTGYNTIPEQTDDTPCIGASGANICGRSDAVACPRRIRLGTHLEIRGSSYWCEDRLAKKFDTRFDISCDKDTACPPMVTGWATVKVFVNDIRRLPVPAPVVPVAVELLPDLTGSSQTAAEGSAAPNDG